MKLADLKIILDQTNIPVAYNHFKNAQRLPFICYLDTDVNSLVADNKVQHLSTSVDIELYTEIKDERLEEVIEQILNDNELPFKKGSSFYIKDEDMFQTIYTIKLI